MGGSRHVVSKFRPLGPIFLCFRVSIFESQQIRAVCRPLANAQNTPQNPVQRPIFELSADRSNTSNERFFKNRSLFALGKHP